MNKLIEQEKNVEIIDGILYIRGNHIELEQSGITISSFTTQDFEKARANNFGGNKFKHVVYQRYEDGILNERDIINIKKYEKNIDGDIYIPNKQ